MSGRWPANVILSPCMAKALDRQSGTVGANGGGTPGANSGMFGTHGGIKEPGARATERDKGGASRFFLQAGYEPWELNWILDNGLRPCGMEEA